jgi:Ca2+-binding RTX toxin-like protein
LPTVFRTVLATAASLISGVATSAGAATILQGTSGNDVLDASASATSYQIIGNGGYDTLIGSSADDTLDGGPGNDSLNGGPGNDRLTGGPGNDTIAGGAGDDTILMSLSNSGFDAIDGGPGTDVLLGSGADDVLGVSSLVGIESIDGGAGFDTLQLASGGRAIDLSSTVVTRLERIVGGSGNDTIIGSSGNDVVIGGGGADRIDGGAGVDTVICSRPFASYSIVANGASLQVRDLVGNEGIDTLTSVERIEFADGVYANGGFTPSGTGNHPPVAADDTATLREDSSIEVAVLANDSDADEDDLAVSIQTLPAHGSASVTATRTIRYTPAANYTGSDTLQYSIADGHGGTSSARVFLQVTAVPDAPVARDDAVSVSASGVVDIDVLANDFDPDGGSISLVDAGTAAHGTTTALADGRVRYEPVSGYSGSDTFSYTIADPTGRTNTAQIVVTVGGSAGNALLSALEAAPAGSWLRVNVNRFDDVWTPVGQRPNTPGYLNPAKVIHAWSSMAWDSKRDRLIFWGGGHANYSGNEVYAFDVRSGRWRRESLPSDVWAPLGDSQFFAVDGPRNAPTSSHTYDNQEYLPRLDRFITFGGAKFNGKQKFVLEDGVTLTGPYLWNPSLADANSVGGSDGSQVKPNVYTSVTGRHMWDDRDTVRNRGVGPVRPSADWVNATSAYMNNGGNDAVLVTEAPRTQARLFRYTISDIASPDTDRWELVGIDSLGYGNQGAGAYDSVRKLYARTAKAASGWGLVVWSLEQPGPTNRSFFVAPTGGLTINELYGMDFDSRRGAFVLWDGGPDVWYVTPSTIAGGQWSAVKAARNTAGALPSQDDGSFISSSGTKVPQRGVLGKWKYAADYDVFFGVINPTAGNVWVYKPANWSLP